MPYETLLRYPGGKSRAVKYLLPLIPEVNHIVSPFFGGGSLELALLKSGRVKRVQGYDIYEPLVKFWQYVLWNPSGLANAVNHFYPLDSKEFYLLQKELPSKEWDINIASTFYVLNRSSFSGSTMSGGMSPGHPRFTLSAIEKLANWSAPGLSVECLSFHESIPKHSGSFLYLDPPYMITSKLYGTKGSTHRDFDHQGLFELLKDRPNWLLSYNDCSEIRELYKGFPMTTPEWTYGMSKDKKSKELLIYPKG